MGKFAAFKQPSDVRTDLEVPTREDIDARLAVLVETRPSAAPLARELASVLAALRSCVPIEGELRVELAARSDAQGGVTVSFFTEQGAVREHALAPATFGLALDELDVALQAEASLFSPLRLCHHKGKVIFTQRPFAATVPPPDVVVASDCLAPPVQESPHEAATRKLPPYVMPEARASGTRVRTDRDDT